MAKNIWRTCTCKKRYRDEHTANLMRKQCEQKRGVKLDYYWCPYCTGFHLTKKVYVYGLEPLSVWESEKLAPVGA